MRDAPEQGGEFSVAGNVRGIEDDILERDREGILTQALCRGVLAGQEDFRRGEFGRGFEHWGLEKSEQRIVTFATKGTYIGRITHQDRVGVHVDCAIDRVFSRMEVDHLQARNVSWVVDPEDFDSLTCPWLRRHPSTVTGRTVATRASDG